MIRLFLTFAALFALLFACHTEKQQANTAGSNSNFFRFKVNGELIESSAHNASYGMITEDVLLANITSSMHVNPKTININVHIDARSVQPGEYNFDLNPGLKPNIAYGGYYPVYGKKPDYLFKSGKFIITQIDTVKKIFSGRLSGTVVNDDGQELEITDGEFYSASLQRF